MKIWKTLFAATAVMLFWPIMGGAAIIYSNLGADDSFQTNSSYEISGRFGRIVPPFESPVLSYACPFTTGLGRWNLTSLDLALVWVGNGFPPPLSDGTNEFQIRIMSDAGGAPGAVLQVIPAILPSNPQLITFSATAPLKIEPETTYWVGVFAAADDAHGAWALNGTGAIGAVNQGNSPVWYYVDTPQGAMRINGDVVPEPASAAVLGAVFALVGASGRRRIKGHR